MFFFLMIRRPPRSTRTDTLFPYTTLFRSISTVAPLTLINHERPWDVTAGTLAPPGLGSEERAAFLAWQRRIAAHVCVQVLDPQTLAYALHDSPVGLLAWLVERRRSWGDCREGLEDAYHRAFSINSGLLLRVSDR